MPPDPESGCHTCWADKLPTGPRQSEGHFGTRFGNGDCRAIVYWRGMQLFHCFEVLPGPGGWAWLYLLDDDGNYINCPCGSYKPLIGRFDSDFYSVRLTIPGVG